MSRADDVINVAAHRLSTGAIEQAIGSHPKVGPVLAENLHSVQDVQCHHVHAELEALLRSLRLLLIVLLFRR